MGKRLHNVLGRIGSKLRFPQQPKSPTDIVVKKSSEDSDFIFIFDWIFVKLAGNEDTHKISDEFDFGPDRTIHLGVNRI